MTSLHGFTPTPRPISELRAYLEEVRASYLERFTRAAAKRGGGAQVAIEMLIEQPDPDEPDQLFRLMRPDVLVIEGESARVEAIEGPYAIDDLLFDFAGTPVTIHDLAWENCLVSVRGPDPNMEAIAVWGALWIDIQDAREPDAAGLRHTIHGLSRPRRVDAEWSMHVDFGSADVDAFVELLEIVTADAQAVDIWIAQ